jgi:anthranilate synthase
MTFDNHFYITSGGIEITRSVTEVDIHTALGEILTQLDHQRGGLLASSYEYPGRYKRWAIGFVNPPLELATRDQTFTLTAHNDRGQILLELLTPSLAQHPQLQLMHTSSQQVTGTIPLSHRLFTEEERSQEPSAFTVVRSLVQTFLSTEDEHLGLYGAFGYDLVFQFEPIAKRLTRAADQRDLVLYLPDELVVVDYYRATAVRLQYDFKVDQASTQDLPRSGESIDYRGRRCPVTQASDHAPGAYAEQVEVALDYFRRGDLFEVVPGQSFFEVCEQLPSQLFQTLLAINPSPYGFLFNLGGEYLIGASPEMFVRVDGHRVETCPISGTIRRGSDALHDADQILELLNSPKDTAELTMCTDVDRNDKSRICKPGSVKVIGRRQIELYSHLIHTVDHVEGILRPGFDALDAFLTHLGGDGDRCPEAGRDAVYRAARAQPAPLVWGRSGLFDL